MSGIGRGLFTHLSANMSTGERCYPQTLPQGVLLPALTWYIIGGEGPVTSHSSAHSDLAPRTLVRQRIQFDCWAVSEQGVDDLSHELMSRLHGFKGQWGDVVIGSCLWAGEVDDYRPDIMRYRRSIDFQVQWIREVYVGS